MPTIHDVRLSVLIMSLIHFAVTALTRPGQLSGEGIVTGLGITGNVVVTAFGFIFILACVSYRPNKSYWNRKLIRVVEADEYTWDLSLKLSPRRV